ncbi:sacsin N-terminal ATP-binding-like domain-containing protein [Streptomyces sp. NPDC087218]|uniref:sacsin N-terminal ATP-binding-like domain-containing protein n=1 Tax=Streptomyces sp. NPDC087218 TaxID=3365769 RepID=UPI003806E969
MDALTTAVHTLLEDPDASVDVEVATPEEAACAVRLFDQGLRSGRGVHRRMAEGALQGAETLSTDRLQVLSEFVQNSDDAEAGQLRVLLRSDDMLIAHDGAGLRLADVLPLGMPWLTGKAADAAATGRFGIGLSTLRVLSTVWEVHCHPFHVRFSGTELEPAPPPELPDGISGPEWTVFRIPLAPGKLTSAQLLAWFDEWNDASLLFLRHLRALEVTAGGHSVGLTLAWADVARHRLVVQGVERDVEVRHARTTDGAVWRVYTAQVEARPEWERSHKALDVIVPVGIALPLEGEVTGSVHAGLPVAPLDVAARVHTQFDPVASREGFADSRLNAQLVPVIADLWEAAVRDVLERVDPTAWHLVPLPCPSGSTPTNLLQDRIHTELLNRARQSLAVKLALPVSQDGPSVPLSDFAVEEAVLSGVLDDTDIARLGEARYALPAGVRDSGGRWRKVLADWRTTGAADMRAEVRVMDALTLFSDYEWSDVARLVRLAAVALETGYEHALVGRTCLVTADGRRLRPQPAESAFADASGGATGPLDVLGVVLDLHPVYAEDNVWAKTVTAWLRRRDCLVRRDDTAAVLKIVSRLGKAGGRLADGDEATEAARLIALQQALGEMPKKQRDPLGPGIGRAVLLNGFAYDKDGIEQTHRVKPGAAYLPQALESADGDRFEVAARRTPGLVWVRRSYARSLLPAARAGGLSGTAFLRLLGVAGAPRLTPVRKQYHPWDTKTYPGDSRLGLARSCRWSVPGRWSQMLVKGADHTLDDLTSSDLVAVVKNIAAEQNVDERRRRTAALLRTLTAALTSSDQAVVPMARGHYKWNVRGETAAIWVWQLRETAWLEDSHGRLKPPADLTLRTPDTVALYGPEDPGYLHPAIHQALATRTEVLTALGVSGNPDVPRLVERLRELRDRADDNPHTDGDVPDSLRAEALLVYQSLARRLTHRSADAPQTAVEKQIRNEFLYEDLVLTDQGWMKPGSCFRGPAILRGFRPFALTGMDVDPLWQALGIPEPGLDDLVDVLKEMSGIGAAPDAEDERVMLDALRRLRDMISSDDKPMPPGLQSRLRNLPLWTTAGWVKGKGRSVFAVADAGVERALTGRLPLWKPGGNVQQFTALFGRLRVTPLDVAGAQVTYETGDVNAAEGALLDQPVDASLTEDFRRGVAALQDLLVRDEPETAEAFTGWAWLAGLDVRLLPGLRIRIDPGPAHEPLTLPVDAQIDRDRNTLFLDSHAALPTKSGAGAAIAAHFAEARSRVGHTWRDVWEERLVWAEAGTALTSAAQRDREERQRLAEELRRRAQLAPVAPTAPMPNVKTTPQRGASTSPAVPTGPTGFIPPPRTGSAPAPGSLGPGTQSGPQHAPVARPLVDVVVFDVLPGKVTRTGVPSTPGSSRARTRGAGKPAHRRHGAPLPRPRPGGAPPSSKASPLGYEDHDKEELVIQALRRILQERGVELEDQRGASGVGADAYDSTGRYYEIKAHGRAVPGELSLTRSEFVRAWTERENYTLVIASHLEKGAGRPTLRLVNDPVHRFEVEPPTDVRLKGVRDLSVESTMYEWPDED